MQTIDLETNKKKSKPQFKNNYSKFWSTYGVFHKDRAISASDH